MSDQAYLTSKSKNVKNLKDEPHIKVSTDYHAELNGFNLNSGDETYDWMAAKEEIDYLSQNCKQASVLLKRSKEISDHWNKIRAQRNARITGAK